MLINSQRSTKKRLAVFTLEVTRRGGVQGRIWGRIMPSGGQTQAPHLNCNKKLRREVGRTEEEEEIKGKIPPPASDGSC